MKKLVLSIVAAGFAWAAIAAGDAPTWTLYQGAMSAVLARGFANSDACVAAANAIVITKATAYTCENSTLTTFVDKLVTTKTTIDTFIAVNVLPPPLMNAGIYVDKVKLAAISRGVGIGTDNISDTVQFPNLGGDGVGSFRTVCMLSHMAFDDPIVMPGQPGASHLHTFFGNTGITANSTVDSISSTGNSTCRGGTINRTAYWQPSVVDTLDGTPVLPRVAIVYYKSGYRGLKPSDIHAMPPGLRMVAGDSKGAEEQQWGPTNIICSTPNGELQAPNGANGMPPGECVAGSELLVNVSFPQCWDGTNLDSPDHRSHMAYPSQGACPVTHPVGVPEVMIRAIYPVTDAAAVKRWRLSSDVYDKTKPAGYSLHADWFNGWKPDIVNTWTDNCVRAGADCQAHMLGDGRTMAEGTP